MKLFPTIALSVLATCALVPGDNAWAQDAAVAATIHVEPSELDLSVGESARIEVTVRDRDGNPIDDAPVIFLPDWGPQFWNLGRSTWGFNLFRIAEDGTVTASQPGTYAVKVRVPQGNDDFLEVAVPLRIALPPITRIEVESLPDRFYAGTAQRLPLRLFDATGAERDDVSAAYRSSNTDVAVIDEFGFLDLRAPGQTELTVEAGVATFSTRIAVEASPGTQLQLSASAANVRTGDVVALDAVVVDAQGNAVVEAPVVLTFNARVDRYAGGGPESGMITEDGRFVADLPGEYTIVATSGALSARQTIRVAPRNARRPVELVGHGRVSEYATSDLWIWEGADGRDYAMTGTHRGEGKALFWDVSDPAAMRIVDSVQVDARNVNDVKVSEDGRVAVISREGASSRRNGIVILDVSAPAEGVRVLAEFDEELTGGVHNLFVYDSHVYALSAGQRYDIINIEDPTQPRRVGRFELPNADRSIHDVWVVDGIAYSANWNDGVVMVDVGGGKLGGSPRDPKMIGKYPFPTGWNHAVFPYRAANGKHYIFAGDEAARSGRFSPEGEIGTATPGYEGEPDRWRGWVHILEWDPEIGGEPRLVARYEVPEAGSHNIWVEDDMMYVAFYNGGLRVVDVSGDLLGDLYRQGREVARFLPFDPQGYSPNAPQVWGAQPYKGHIFFSDYNSGLWAVRLGASDTDE